jgi:hypothetical protein
VNRNPSVYAPTQIVNLLGSAKPDQKNKKGGKVVVVQVIKIKFPQQTPPYGYYYPPPPGGSYYYGPLLPPPQPTPPVVTSEKPDDQDWKKYRDKYAHSKDKKKKKKEKQNEDLDFDTHSSGPSMSPPELNVSTDSSNRRTSTKPYNWQQWVKGGNSTAGATNGDSSNGDSYDWQKWTNPNVTLNGSRIEDGGYDWHQWVDKYKAGAPSVEPSGSPTDHPTTSKSLFPSNFPTGVPSPKATIHPSNLPGIASPTDRPTATTIFLHPSYSPSTQSKGEPSPAGVVEPGRLLEDTYSIEVNVSCNSAFLEPVFRDFIEEQRVSRTLADNISLEDARQIAANLYQEQDGDGQAVIMYVDYDDDNHTADMVLVHGFDIFNNYREHFEFIPTSTQSIQGNTRSAIRMPAPEPKCRIVRTLSAVLTSTAALGGITAVQWLSDHEEDMRKFKEYVESLEVTASTVAPILSPVVPIQVPVAHRPARGPRASSPSARASPPGSAMSAPMAPATKVGATSPAPTLGTATPTIVPSQVIPTADTAAPTVAPTLAPIPVRTVSPTLHPTVSPTFHPTVTPTLHPTVSPTFHPTFHPTLTPTFHPTVSPTLGPTVATTPSPTRGPTVSPTVTSTHDLTVTPVSHIRAPVKRRRREPVAHADIHKERKHGA